LLTLRLPNHGEETRWRCLPLQLIAGGEFGRGGRTGVRRLVLARVGFLVLCDQHSSALPRRLCNGLRGFVIV